MKIKTIQDVGIQSIYDTNVEELGTYISDNGIIHKNCVIDTGNQGEVHINLINTSNMETSIKYGEKIIQFVMFRIDCDKPEYVSSLAELYPKETEKNSGGFGSTGT